ncbi:MAG: HAD-IB family hydrolase, partial [Fusobacteriaceae bacterium]
MIAAFFDIDGTIYRDSLLIEHFKKLIKYELIDLNQYERKVKESYKLWDERKGDYDSYLQDLTTTYVEAIRGLSLQYNNFIADQVLEL